MLIVATLLALLVWAFFGAVAGLGAYCAGLLFVVYRERLHLRALATWMRNPQSSAIPEAGGAWGECYALLSRLLRNQRNSESTLSAALDRFQQAGAAIPDGLIILREDDHIEWCNPGAEAHFGIALAKDEGQQITYLVRSPQFAEYLASPHHPEPIVLRIARDLERTVLLSVQIVPFGDKQRLVLSRDITSIEAVETMRRDFVANVSHELRTPLTVVIGFLETVLDMKGVPQNALRPLSLAMDQAGRMQRLVEDLLTLSRLESADNSLRDDVVDVPALLRTLQQEAIALSGGRHRIALDMQARSCVLGSTEELRSAFGNLITNAIRYTPDGGEITLVWRAVDGQMEFAVQDSGIGVEAQHIPRLTERFYRVDRSRSRETGGTGLGLAIVKHVATRHRARLEIASTVGVGSRFAVVFPPQRVVAESLRELDDPGKAA